jgi:twinkle protein
MPQDLIPFGEAQALPKRGITDETCRKFGYTIGEHHGEPVQIATYRDGAGTPVAQKLRFKDKQFKFIGDTKKAGLFGQHLWRSEGSKMLVITEGEIDALSMSQVQGNRFPVVSVGTGAAGAKKAVANSLEFVEGFEKVVIMFDNDEAGRLASQEVAAMLSVGKAAIATLPLKDANDMLQAGKGAELISAMWEAKIYRPDGIIDGQNMWETIMADDESESIDYPFDGLNQKTLGMRRGELVTITAGSGVGKSQVCREIAYELLNRGESIGYIALEENTKRTALGLMGLSLEKPLHLSKDGISEAVMRTAFDETVGSGRVFLYDHFGSLATDNLLNRVRYLAKACNVGWVILDHLSIVVSGVDNGDERKAIDVIMTKLRSLCEETGIGLILVSHLKRPSGDKGWENGLETNLNSLRGSAAIAQLSDICLGVERDQQSDTPDISTIRVLKNRFTGETGVGCFVHYNKETGRMVEVEDPTVFADETNDGEVTEDF